MSLTIVIPCHDDRPGLVRALSDIHYLGVADRIVVVDDGSAEPLDAADLCAATGVAENRLALLRNETAQGPGLARNRAVPMVETDLLLFLDADDRPTVELRDLLADLAEETFDFCLFCHHDTRRDKERAWGPTVSEAALWDRAGCRVGALRSVTDPAAALLAQTPNYPWNKIYRTGFLQAEPAVRCSESVVHEDVELHWRSFFRADRILSSDRVCVIHHVAEDGARLTNYAGAARLAVFDVFDRLSRDLAEDPARRDRYQAALTAFSLDLAVWIAGNLHADLQPRLRERLHRYLKESVPEDTLARLRETDPALLARLPL